MRLTRRDALAALAAGTAGAGAYAATRQQRGSGETDAERTAPEGDVPAGDALVAIAEVVYPSAVEGVEEFVRAYVVGRRSDDEYAAGVEAAVAELNDLARSWHGAAVPDLDLETRDQLLREVGADTADPDADGTTAERVRHYVVNELLYALYTSPTGGALAGIENPIGHPGGRESYAKGPGE